MPTTTTTLNREEIKANIEALNHQAQVADATMRVALQAGDQAAALNYRQQRDNYNAQVKELTALLQANSATTSSTPTALTSDAFVVATANAFHASNSQDQAQNAILQELLTTAYKPSAIPLGDSKALAYDAIRTNSGQPLHWIRNAQQAQTLFNSLPLASAQQAKLFPKLTLSGKKVGESFFIRDFIQLYSQGDVALENLIVVDEVLNSTFARDFNLIVERINRYQQQQGRVRLVWPFKQLAHRDAFQLIPEPVDGIDRYGGAIMRNARINNNVVFSAGALQGIFASDGAFKDLHIRNNFVTVEGEHTISISGMLSGSVSNNRNVDNQPLSAEHITLYPLRIGGGANIFILGFVNKPFIKPSDANYYQYEPIAGISATSDQRQGFKPGTPIPPASTFYRRVDMVELQALIKSNPPKTAEQWRALMGELNRKGFAQTVSV